MCGHGPSGRNGGFCETLWTQPARPRRALRRASARSPPREASSDSVGAIGAWCEAQGVDAWFQPPGLPVRLDRRGAGRRCSTGCWRAGADHRRPDRARSTPTGCARAATRRASAAALLVPDDATVHPARLALGLRARVIERGAQVFEHSRVRALHAGADVVAETAGGRVRAGAAVIAVNAAARGDRAAAPPARGHLLAHRAHRAGARRARGDRLDRRRVDHRRAHVPALLPHHRTTAASCSAGAAGGSPRARGSRPRRGRPGGGRGDAPPPRRDAPRRSTAPHHARVGRADRRLARATSRRSARSTARRSTTRSASPATASARRTSRGASSPRARAGETPGRRAARGRPGARPARAARLGRRHGRPRRVPAQRAPRGAGPPRRPAHPRGLRGAEGARHPRRRR